MKRELIRELKELEGNEGQPLDLYWEIRAVINEADGYYYPLLDQALGELLAVLNDGDLEAEMQRHAWSISSMRIFLGDAVDADIYELKNGNLKKITIDTLETVILDLIEVLEND